MAFKYYDLTKILKTGADYLIIIGERSNGKTYATLKYGLEKYFKDGSTMGYIRRWEEDFRSGKGASLFKSHVNNKVIEKLSKGEYNDTYYFGSKWFFCKVEDGEIVKKCSEPFCYAFSINNDEHYKSLSYPNLNTIIFDEFLTRKMYLTDEFIRFQNLLSTIIRLRDNVKIFMLGNTVNKYCPYFQEMGLKRIDKMIQGTIDVYQYGTSRLKVAVEYCGSSEKNSKPSNFYFAFDNPRLKMIQSGEWEIDIYPHLPYKYLPKNVYYRFIIVFDNQMLEGEFIHLSSYSYIENDKEKIMKKSLDFIFIHRKTTPIKEDFKGLVFTSKTSPKMNYRKVLRGLDEIEKLIIFMFKADKVFYSDNEVGEIVNNFLLNQKINV